jgi:hypothetical protein
LAHDLRGGGGARRQCCRIRSVKFRELDPLSRQGPGPSGEAPWWDQGHHEAEFEGEAVRISLEPGSRLKDRIGRDDGRWMLLVLRRRTTEGFPADSGGLYVDVLDPDTAKTFIQTTHDEYFHRFGRHLGTTVRGFFVDEPGL